MTKPLFTVVALLISAVSFGQDYIVTMKSDTLKGEVRLLSYDLLDRIQLSQEGKKKTTYTALQVRRATIKGESYSPVKFDNAIRMMKMIRSGFISVYSFRAPGQTSYDTRVIQKIGESAIEVPNIGFKKIVGDIVADCPAVADKVKNGDFDRYHIEGLIDQYNECIANSSARRVEAAQHQVVTPASKLINDMKTKVNASDLTNKNDVNDLLNSIADRLNKKETVPAYMKEGLKGYLSSNEDLKADMDQLFKLIEN
jgi:hypothetical protein